MRSIMTPGKRVCLWLCPLCEQTEELTEDEKIDIVAARILNRFRPAFEELAK